MRGEMVLSSTGNVTYCRGASTPQRAEARRDISSCSYWLSRASADSATREADVAFAIEHLNCNVTLYAY